MPVRVLEQGLPVRGVKMKFCKLQASGNDFILIDSTTSKGKHSANFYKDFAKKYCERRLSIGADGLLVIEPSKKADFMMRIFNSDGSEAEMCGNGARCAAYWVKRKLRASGCKLQVINFETKAGIIESKIIEVKAKGKESWEEIQVKMIEPFGLAQGTPVKVFTRNVKVDFINTGVPHAVIFVDGLNSVDVEGVGRAVRFHKQFSPEGANVNFVEFKSKDFIKLRTYERGVEGETLACGTGSIASAIIAWLKIQDSRPDKKKSAAVKVETKSKEILKVCFDIDKEKIDNVWLEGRAHLVYEGNV
ncbi:MAG: diaminopimelate epimerase [Candidatus Omnitrophota bacterium]